MDKFLILYKFLFSIIYYNYEVNRNNSDDCFYYIYNYIIRVIIYTLKMILLKQLKERIIYNYESDTYRKSYL